MNRSSAALALLAALAASPARADDIFRLLPGAKVQATPKGGAEALPAGLRVVKLAASGGKTNVLYYLDGVRTGWVESASLGPRAGGAPSPEAFVQDAKLALYLSASLATSGNAPHWPGFLKRLASSARAPSQGELQAWSAALEKDLGADASDKPGTMSRLTTAMFAGLDPGAMSRRILYVPLSLEWFGAHPKLEAFFERRFKGKDRRLAGGSGEGISGEELEFWKDFLLDLKDESAKDRKAAATPEGRWLAGLTEDELKAHETAVFLHSELWADVDDGAAWAEFIPVDLALGGLRESKAFSVLVHETNVNTHSPSYLPSDTHGDTDRGAPIRAKLAAKELKASDLSAWDLRLALQLNPHITAVYLSYLLDHE